MHAAEGPLPDDPFRHRKVESRLGVGPCCAFEHLAGGSKGATAWGVGQGVEGVFTSEPCEVGDGPGWSEREMRRLMQQVQHTTFSLRPVLAPVVLNLLSVTGALGEKRHGAAHFSVVGSDKKREAAASHQLGNEP